MAWKTLVGCLAIGTMLSGCIKSPSEIRAMNAAKYKATCTGIGYKVGTIGYNECILREERYIPDTPVVVRSNSSGGYPDMSNYEEWTRYSEKVWDDWDK